MNKELPEIGEIVVCKINKILDYGVFVELLEYEGVTGFVHISQVASSWIKNIRNYVKENQTRAAQVTNIDSKKNQIDLSFVKVSPSEQRLRIEEFKQVKRSQKLIELLAKEKKKSFEVTWEKVAEPLIQNYGSLYKAFETITLEKQEACKGVEESWIPSLVSMVEKNIESPRKIVRGVIELHSLAFNGVEIIKDVLLKTLKTVKGEKEFLYKGSNKFLVRVTSTDYKSAEKKLKEICETAVELIKKQQGTGQFQILGKKEQT